MLNSDILDFEEDIEDDIGYLLNVFLVDTNANILKALRLISLPNKFSRLLRENILVQLNQTLFIKEVYENNVINIFSSYSTKDLLKYSIIKERI